MLNNYPKNLKDLKDPNNPKDPAPNGFTLLELLLYISLLAVVVVLVSSLWSVIIEARVKNQVILAVETEGQFASNFIGQAARNATAINSPSLGASDTTLSLQMSNPLKDPTIFRLDGDRLKVKEGADAELELTSDKVQVLNLNFQNLSSAGGPTPGTIRFSFDLKKINNTGRNEYNWQKSFNGSNSLRP